jgi:cysteine-rich repeat protein
MVFSKSAEGGEVSRAHTLGRWAWRALRVMAPVVLLVAAFAVVAPVRAQAPDVGIEYAQSIGLGTQDVRTTTSNIIRAFMGALGLVAVGLILYAGFLWMTSAGDAEKVKKAQQTMLYSTLGLVVIFSAYAIARFVFGALGVDVGSGPVGGCIPGQVCTSGDGGGGLGGSAGGFRVDSVSPVGSGPQKRGWPKNSAINITFTSPVDDASVTSGSIEVRRCDSFGVIGDVNPFDAAMEASCGTVVAGTLDVEGRRVTFRPIAEEGEEPMFEPGSWYRVRVLGNAVKDTSGRTVICNPRPEGALGDISSPRARRDLCERAMAFADILDVEPPQASVTAPVSPPAYCAVNSQIAVQVAASDDFLVADVEVRLDDSTEGLVDGSGSPRTSMEPVDPENPTSWAGVFIDGSFANDGLQHEISVTPRDASGKVGQVATATFVANPPHCCNGKQDADFNETGLDCGIDSGCGVCGGGSCTEDAQCQSGFCSASGNVCEDRPVIDAVSPTQAGAGSMVTISGRFFGAAEGRVVFLGADTDGNGDRKGDADDVDATSCAQGAWSGTQVTIVVPANAVTGPIELRTAAGKSDRTDVAPGFSGTFTVAGPTKPGICFLEPFAGAVGSGLVIHGVGFGDTKGTSTALFGGRELAIGQGGWSDGLIRTIVPNVREGGYGVNVRIDAATESNLATYSVTPSANAVQPRISAIIPSSGPVGGSFTIQGTGFGNSTGHVRLYFGNGTSAEIADALPPSCSESWHDTYVVVKVPEKYRSGNVLQSSAAGVIHKVELETTGNFRTGLVDFKVDHSPVRPTICAVVPDNGPAGRSVEIIGEGFGNGPGSPTDEPKFAAEFFKAAGVTVPATSYGSWTTSKVTTAVPGIATDRSTWPASGPVRLRSAGVESANAVPFTVQNCTDKGVSCPAGTQCCAQSGSCAESCAPVDRSSSYGWQLSTDVLPSIPRVVERSSCNKDDSQPQSPSPSNGSQDACGNAAVLVEFNRRMNWNLITPSTVHITECGDGDAPDCDGGASVPLDADFDFADGTGTVAMLGPSGTYNSGMWKANGWYQVVLTSTVGGVGIQDVTGKYLDGDRDGAEGGDYVWTFRTSPTGGACGVDYVNVNPGRATIREQGGTLATATPFISVLMAGNCNSIRCTAGASYDIAWRTDSEETLELLAPGEANECPGAQQPVVANKETDPGKPAELFADVSSRGGKSASTGMAEVTVKFSDPVVAAHGPDCEEACINAEVYALFNVTMDASTFAPERGNVELLKCRDAACNPPYDPAAQRRLTVTTVKDDAGLVRGLSMAFIPDSTHGAELEPASYYVARLRGGIAGIRSASGVPLSGLTEGDFYTWTFRTKDSAAPCTVSKATLSPSQQIMSYVGERAEFRVVPFGAPDQCDVRGQALRGESYNWRWDNQAGFVAGFVDPLVYPQFGQSRLDTAPTGVLGCTDRCTLSGSQNAVVQCGNGRVEAGEECDGGAGCTNRCLNAGTTAPACGNGTIAPGESCEKIGGAFPPGCKDPGVNVIGRADLDGVGCILLGSSTAGKSRCGDGRVTDGESCDDGNGASGDGCSAQCLREGTLRSCLDAGAGEPCVNFCGNGRAEPGEDPVCEAGGNPAAAGCSPLTCLRTGTPACGSTAKGACCGNGVAETGEEPSCETAGGVAEFCTKSCVLAGSSFAYASPSFCRDGLVGLGEALSCDGSAITRDGKNDPRQAIEAGLPSDQSSTTTILASLPEIVRDENKGKATVSLSCTCSEQSDPQAFCAAIGRGKSPAVALGCASSGCCALTPRVEDVRPVDGSQAQCRNAQLRVVFDASVDSASVQAGVLVGEAVTGTSCNGRPALPALAYAGDQPGVLARMWNAVTGFFRGLLGRDASAEPLPNPKTTTYCVVPGTFSASGREATFVPEDAMKANTWYRIFVNGDVVKGSNSVPLGVDYNSHFRTGGELCRVGSVSIVPTSHLFTISEDLGGAGAPADAIDGDHPFVAQAHPQNGGTPIVSTPSYRFAWRWDRPAAADQNTVITVTRRAPPAGVTGDDATATVAVRRGEEGFPKNGETPVRVTAELPPDDSGAPSSLSASSKAVVMLCQQPWPARRVCRDGAPFPALPWDRDARCDVPGDTVWYPFYDKATGVEFYYCRDGQEAGDAGDLLPALREDVVRVQPGRDILFEYLFTFDQSSAGASASDAVGLRVAKNLTHQPVAAWYRDQGFRGNPSPTEIGGRPALVEGRTVYVDAATRAGSDIYTNVNIFSHSDAAAPSTIAVFNRLLENVDFARNLRDFGYCIDKEGKQQLDSRGEAVACTADPDCLVVTDGKLDSDSVGSSCLAVESKLVRDVRRWQDLHAIRERVLGRGAGSFPKLEAGTYLRSQTTSRWPSWEETLGDELGGALPSDPINTFTACADGADPATCFDEAKTLYQCPAGSHVYEYQSVGGIDFRLRNDFETACAAIASQAACEGMSGVDADGKPEPYCSWDKSAGCQSLVAFAGATCLEQREPEVCNETLGCSWDGAACNYAVGQIQLGGITAGPVCSGAVIGEGGVCGDGIVQGKEACEPGGAADIRQCEVEGSKRLGSQARSCRNDCTFGEFGACSAGTCGDGILQAGAETCDDGELNGTYGFCNSTCSAQGFRCGDGARQPSEACDCGVKNGSYVFNGLMDAAAACRTTGAGAPSCSFDCSAPAPRCGDGAVNGAEQCDGGFQESVGYCNGASGTALANAPCTTSAQCGAGQCVTCPTPEQKMRRSCNPNDTGKVSDDAAACTYAAWACTAPGTCGDGVKNTGEECDDGNTNNNDACVIDPAGGYQCRTSRCGDGYRDGTAGEQCDNGASNGVPCVPGYGQSCQYCTTSCRAVSGGGGFCGDGRVQSPGAAFCSISNAPCSASSPCAAGAGVCQVQPGPEQCEGAQGLLPNYVCVSTIPADRKLGVRTNSSCLVASCTQGCGSGATMCFNDPSPSAPNFDGDQLTDVCDPDRDNDKVPLDLDCDDFDPARHGSYLDEPAALEVCGDSKDNDCDGFIDNASIISGTVRDLVTGNTIGGATVQVRCGNLVVGETVTSTGFSQTSSPGAYTVTARVNGICPDLTGDGQPDFTVIAMKEATQGGSYCTNDYLAARVSVVSCPATATADLFLMAKPPVGGRHMDVSWTPKTGLSFALIAITDDPESPNDSSTATFPMRVVNTGTPSRMVTRSPLTTLAPWNKLKAYLQTPSSQVNAKGSNLAARIWDNGCNVTTITSDDTTGPSPSRFWDMATIVNNSAVTTNNTFSTSRPSRP